MADWAGLSARKLAGPSATASTAMTRKVDGDTRARQRGGLCSDFVGVSQAKHLVEVHPASKQTDGSRGGTVPSVEHADGGRPHGTRQFTHTSEFREWNRAHGAQIRVLAVGGDVHGDQVRYGRRWVLRQRSRELPAYRACRCGHGGVGGSDEGGGARRENGETPGLGRRGPGPLKCAEKVPRRYESRALTLLEI